MQNRVGSALRADGGRPGRHFKTYDGVEWPSRVLELRRLRHGLRGDSVKQFVYTGVKVVNCVKQ